MTKLISCAAFLLMTVSLFGGYRSMDVHTDTGTVQFNLSSIDSVTFTMVWEPGDTLIDARDGQRYATVVIGTQCWMAENLNVGVYLLSVYDGMVHSDASDNGSIEKYAYDNDTVNFTAYGGLYDWDEAMGYSTTEGVKGICPDGWHMPTDAEWTILVNTIGGPDTGGSALAEGGSSGFEALYSGLRNNEGSFWDMGTYVRFWSSSQYNTELAWLRNIITSEAKVNRGYDYKTGGHCVRCLKD
jgi:uncharacterized protein (TIGR02145 family)